MSGMDEKPLKDFPHCSRCFEVQGVTCWAGRGNSPIVYFDCIGYNSLIVPRVVVRRALSLVEATLEQVNRVTFITCGFCGVQADDVLFEKIIKLGREIVVRNR